MRKFPCVKSKIAWFRPDNEGTATEESAPVLTASSWCSDPTMRGWRRSWCLINLVEENRSDPTTRGRRHIPPSGLTPKRRCSDPTTRGRRLCLKVKRGNVVICSDPTMRGRRRYTLDVVRVTARSSDPTTRGRRTCEFKDDRISFNSVPTRQRGDGDGCQSR